VLAWPTELTPRRAAGAGVALGAAALARPEALLVLPVVLLWVSLVRGRALGRELAMLAAVALVAVAPWEVHMYRAFDTWLPTTSLGATLEGANRPSARAGTRIGELVPVRAAAADENEGLVDSARRAAGWRALRSHATPVVVGARVLRGWDLLSPSSIRDARAVRGLETPGGPVGVVVEGAASVIAVGWLVMRRREWRRLLPFFLLPAAFTALSAVTFGSRDLRAWVAPLVAVAVASLVARVRRRVPSGARSSTPRPRAGRAPS
jgi:hypothetical protein